MDVPLVIAGPGFTVGRVEEAVCGLADIAPTLRAATGLKRQKSDGNDLRARQTAGDRVVCGESLYAHRRYGWAQISVATDGRYSLVDGGPRLELFDRVKDPGEEHPLSNPTAHAVYARLDRALFAYRGRVRAGGSGIPLAGAPTYYGAQVVPEGDFSKPAKNRLRRDVSRHIADVATMDQAEEAIRIAKATRRRLAFDLEPLAALTRNDPKNPAARLTYGRALLYLRHDATGAAREIEAAMAAGFSAPSLFRLLAEVYRLAGDLERAAAAQARAERKK